MLKNDYSSHDSEEEDDQVDLNYLNKVRSQRIQKLIANQNVSLQNIKQSPYDDDMLLKPKLSHKNPSVVISNSSSLTNKNAKTNRRPLTAAYTFKLSTPKIKRKNNDPVSLFQATNQLWSKDKFLVSRANNKQGRKLQLDKRNKNNQIPHYKIE